MTQRRFVDTKLMADVQTGEVLLSIENVDLVHHYNDEETVTLRWDFDPEGERFATITVVVPHLKGGTYDILVVDPDELGEFWEIRAIKLQGDYVVAV